MTESHATLAAEVARLRKALREIEEITNDWVFHQGAVIGDIRAIARRALRGE